MGDVAGLLECDTSKVSRIETGDRGIRARELRELLAEYGTDGAVVQALEAVTQSARGDAGWWADYEKILPAPYLELAGAEACASAIAVYAPLQVPELLQVPAYSSATAAADPLVPQERQESVTAAVASRQRVVLTDRALPVEAVIGEAALRSRAEGPLAMRAQLAHLAETAERSGHVTVRLLPFTAGPSAPGGSARTRPSGWSTWPAPQAACSPPACRPPPTTCVPSSKAMTMDEQQAPGSPLHDFERVHFDRLRLAAQVILEAAPDLELVTDPHEAELLIFKDRVEFLLLLPDDADSVIPWRRMLNGEPPPARGRQAGGGDE